MLPWLFKVLINGVLKEGKVLELGLNLVKNGELWKLLLLLYTDHSVVFAKNEDMLGLAMSAFVEVSW